MGILIKKYIWIAYLFLTAMAAFFLAKTVNTFLGDKLVVERKFDFASAAGTKVQLKALPSFDFYQSIISRNIFDSKDASVEPVPTDTESQAVDAPLNLDGPATPTTLNIKLLSTFSVGAGMDKRSTATVQADKGGPDVYTVDDSKQFAPGVRITKILSDRIEFVNNNKLEYVELENVVAMKGSRVSTQAPSNSYSNNQKVVDQSAPNKFTIDRSAIDQALADSNRLLTEIRAIPNMVNGKTQGMKIMSVAGGSLFSKLGLQRGDVLYQANGLEMNIENMSRLIGMLKTEKNISINLERAARKQTFDYEIR